MEEGKISFRKTVSNEINQSDLIFYENGNIKLSVSELEFVRSGVDLNQKKH